MGKYAATSDEYTPTITPTVRTAIYVVSLGVNVTAGITLVVLLVLELVAPTAALAIFGAVMWGLSTVSNALAVGYRPTRPDINPDGTPAS